MSTVKLSLEVKEELASHRNYPKESLESVVVRILEHYNKDVTLTEQELADVQKGLEDVKAGRIISHNDVKKKFGLK